MINIYNTHTLLMAVQQITPPSSFLRDRYFPTNDITDIFATEDVLVEYRDGDQIAAPFVSPRKNGVTVLRQGAYMKRYTPPHIAPIRPLTMDELKQRGFGEALFMQFTPEQRQLAMMMQDAEELGNMITRREEAMAAEILLTNECIVKSIADDTELTEDDNIKFFDDESNPATYTPAVKWNEEGANIIGDIYAMAQMLIENGLPATDLIVSPDVAQIIINDANIQKILDIRHFNMGNVEPMQLAAGANRIADINVLGVPIDIISYAMEYTENKKRKKYIPDGYVVLTAPGAGKTVYAAVSQLEQHDGNFHTYYGKRVPKYVSDANSNTRKLTLTARPLLIPVHKNPWISAKVTA